jgi:hypothetical protein
LRAEEERLARIEAAETWEELDLAARPTLDETSEGRGRAWRVVLLAAVYVLAAVGVFASLGGSPSNEVVSPSPPVAHVDPPTESRPAARRPTHGVQLPETFEPSVFLIRSTGGAARRLDVPPAHSWQPAWRPDGRALAVVSDQGIVELSVSGEGPVRGQPVWSHRRELVTMSLPTLLPAYSPDGQRLAFSVDTEIWAVSLGPQAPVKRLLVDATGFVGSLHQRLLVQQARAQGVGQLLREPGAILCERAHDRGRQRLVHRRGHDLLDDQLGENWVAVAQDALGDLRGDLRVSVPPKGLDDIRPPASKRVLD